MLLAACREFEGEPVGSGLPKVKPKTYITPNDDKSNRRGTGENKNKQTTQNGNQETRGISISN